MTGGCIGIWRLFKRLGGYIWSMEVVSRIWRWSEPRVGIDLLGKWLVGVEFEFNHHAVSTSFLERLWSYFRKMSKPLPKQPFLTKFWIQAWLLWCDPGHQRWPGPSSQFILYNFITPSLHNQATHCHVWELTSTPAASQLGALTGSVCQSCFNILPQQHPPAISMFHQTAYWVAPLWSTCSPSDLFDSYVWSRCVWIHLWWSCSINC